MHEEEFDLVGIGFGPANLALAITLEDEHQGLVRSGWRYRFFEQQAIASWHSGMLIPDMTLQTSFLKDLVTLRNPRSRFSFLNYLHVHGRLHKFVNLRTFYPSRIEYDHYLRWAAGQLRDWVEYGATVEAIRPGRLDADGRIGTLRVRVRGHRGTLEYLARTVVIGSGRVPALPSNVHVRTGNRIFHSADFLDRICRYFSDTSRRYSFAVVGSGQSAAEIFHFLLRRYPRSEVTAVLRQWAYKQADTSEFVNELYAPATTDVVYHAPAAARPLLIDRYRDTNYSVVDASLISEIYQTIYTSELVGERRANFVRLHEVAAGGEEADAAELLLRDLANGGERRLRVDAAIFATGYSDECSWQLLDGVRDLVDRDESGGPRVDRSYRVRTDPRLRARIFVQGLAEESHGLSDPVLSIIAVRAGEIASAITAQEQLSAAVAGREPVRGEVQ